MTMIDQRWGKSKLKKNVLLVVPRGVNARIATILKFARKLQDIVQLAVQNAGGKNVLCLKFALNRYLIQSPTKPSKNQIQPCQIQGIAHLHALTVATMTHVVQMKKNIVTNVAHPLRKNESRA